mmetsp:Transcript_136878/g.437912  ORF Transcript_136878/g.437912 Transcript_136878/m.437912 type:complete len:245 (-) Transcript_136878:1133-1867(-)
MDSRRRGRVAWSSWHRSLNLHKKSGRRFPVQVCAWAARPSGRLWLLVLPPQARGGRAPEGVGAHHQDRPRQVLRADGQRAELELQQRRRQRRRDGDSRPRHEDTGFASLRRHRGLGRFPDPFRLQDPQCEAHLAGLEYWRQPGGASHDRGLGLVRDLPQPRRRWREPRGGGRGDSLGYGPECHHRAPVAGHYCCRPSMDRRPAQLRSGAHPDQRHERGLHHRPLAQLPDAARRGAAAGLGLRHV